MTTDTFTVDNFQMLSADQHRLAIELYSGRIQDLEIAALTGAENREEQGQLRAIRQIHLDYLDELEAEQQLTRPAGE